LPFYPHPIPSPPDASSKITPQDIVQDMDRALTERIYNVTEQERKRNLLIKIYRNHTKTIRQWAQQFHSSLVEIIVDETHDIVNNSKFTLDRLLRDNNFVTRKEDNDCPWKYDPPDDDWKNYRLPFTSAAPITRH
jgi:hypothetical protein